MKKLNYKIIFAVSLVINTIGFLLDTDKNTGTKWTPFFEFGMMLATTFSLIIILNLIVLFFKKLLF